MADFLPGEETLDVYRGDTFSQAFEFFEDEAETVPFVLPATGTWRAQVRAVQESVTLAATFDVDASLAAQGRLVLSMPAAATATLPESCWWDIEHAEGGTVRTYLRGPVNVIQDVTR